MTNPSSISRALLKWYRAHHRDLPWRRTSDPYAIWISEVMLQQTRVEAVLPYYARFLARFPNVRALARAPQPELLGAWAGLGYYSRVRNLQRAAREIVRAGQFPTGYDAIRALPGVGAYTAAAIASIAFGERRAALDGNVMRVMARLTCEAGDIRQRAVRERLQAATDALVPRRDPGLYNQAVMELGATICLPANPACARCPVARFCAARAVGRERELPVKSKLGSTATREVTLAVVRRGTRLLLWRRGEAGRMAGFWELPERAMLPDAKFGVTQGEFRHVITNTQFHVSVVRARVRAAPGGMEWVESGRLGQLPLSTVTRKALALGHSKGNV